jgi:hypothetical protein
LTSSPAYCRFQLSRNLALDGVLDSLNSKSVIDAGPLELVDDDEDAPAIAPPAAAGGAAGVDRLPGAPCTWILTIMLGAQGCQKRALCAGRRRGAVWLAVSLSHAPPARRALRTATLV